MFPKLLSFSKRLKIDEYLIIPNCLLAFSMELACVSIISNSIYDFAMKQIKAEVIVFSVIHFFISIKILL